MDIYLDLSLCGALAVHLLSFCYLKMMIEVKINKAKIIMMIICMIIPVFSLPFYLVDSFWFYLTYYLVILFFFLPRQDKFKAILLYGLSYFITLSSLCLITSSIDHYHFVLLIRAPVGMLYLFLLPLPFLLFYLISYLLKKKIAIYHFIFKVNLKYEERILAMKGYLDSGNTLLYQGRPVVFIKESMIKDLELNDPIEISYNTLGGKKFDLAYQGIICLCKYYKKSYRQIYFSIIDDNQNLNDCQCLLNAHLI